MTTTTAAMTDSERLAAMRKLGVIWKPSHAIPTYTATMTKEQCQEADRLYDGMTEQFIDENFGIRRLTFIKFGSHRARDRALSVWRTVGLGQPQAYCSFKRWTGKGVYWVTQKHLEALVKDGPYPYGRNWYTGVREPHDDLMRCWND